MATWRRRCVKDNGEKKRAVYCCFLRTAQDIWQYLENRSAKVRYRDSSNRTRNKFKKQVLVGNWEATTETTKKKEGQSCRVTVEQSENPLKMERGKTLN
jgi:hypothetical protein